MADATTDRLTPMREGDLIEYGVQADIAIQKGVLCFVSTDTGYVTDAVADASGNIRFVGVSKAAVASSDTSGNAKVLCKQSGMFEFLMSGAAITDIGAECYVSDNQTVKTTQNGAIVVGTIVAFENAGKVFVDIRRR